MKQKGLFAFALAVALLVPATTPRAQQAAAPADAAEPVLKPTNHPRLPADLSQLWLAPVKTSRARTAAINELVVRREARSRHELREGAADPVAARRPAGHARRICASTTRDSPNCGWDVPPTRAAPSQALAAKNPVGYLVEAAALREAECDEALGDQAGAMDIYTRLAGMKTTAPDDVLMRLGRAAERSAIPTRRPKPSPASSTSFRSAIWRSLASAELENLPLAPIAAGTHSLQARSGTRRAALRRQALRAGARGVRGRPRAAAQGDDRELVNLRLAECDYFLKRPRTARDGLKPYIEKSARQGEALYFYAVALRDLGDRAEYQRIVRRLVDEFPSQSWAEEALNNLATHYILQSDDENADATFREMYEKFPIGALRRARRVEDRLVRRTRTGGYADTDSRVRVGGGAFPALGLPADAGCTGRPGARRAATSRRSPRRATRWSPPTT